MSSTPPRRLALHLGRVLAVLVAAAPLGAGVARATSGPAAPGERTVAYRGVEVTVPAGWPVVDLEAEPDRCLLLTAQVVYLGNPGADQRCPSPRIGERRAVWVAVDRAGRGVLTGPRVGDVATARDASRAGVSPTSAAPVPAPSPQAVAAVATSRFTGMGFDTCTAPSLSAMQAWRSSPYRVAGIYLGGINRACGDGNLSASWVSSVIQNGWGLLPIYVGLQAPCVQMAGVQRIDPANATAQGRQAAADAVAQATRFALGTGTTVFLDIENYTTPNAACTAAVLGFVTAWTDELRRVGYRSGVYGNPPSLMTDLSNARAAGRTDVSYPDTIWFALWNGRQTVYAQAQYAAFKDAYWPGARVHQYRGDYTETWNGVRQVMDANWVDATLPGRATAVSYGTNVTGPGGAGFAFTGDMQYWRPAGPSGLQGMAHWTGTTNATESNGATWTGPRSASPQAVAAYVPAGVASGIAVYTVGHAGGSTTVRRDQSTTGWISLGTFSGTSSAPITVHLGDNANAATSERIVADAVRFTSTPPGTTARPSAAPSSGAATVSWTPAASNGSTVTGYTVVATPGGRMVTVAGTARSAKVTGLTNGTGYAFAVRATNAFGNGTYSPWSTTVTPLAGAPFTGVTASRLVDTRRGTTANPRRTALAPGETLTVKVAGVTGSPIPAGVRSALLNLTATGATTSGYIAVVGPNTSSALNFRAARTIANAAYAPLEADGTVRLRNVSAGTVQLVLDAQAQVRSGGQEWTTITPRRLLDTRAGTSVNTRKVALNPGEQIRVRISGATGSPVPAGSSTALVNLTVTQPTDRGYLSVTGGTSTATSTVNFARGGTVANLVAVRPAADGTIAIRNASMGRSHVILDVQGYAATTASQVWTPVTAARLLDTRAGTPANSRTVQLAPGEVVRFAVAGRLGSPVPTGAHAAVLNVTATDGSSAGYLSFGDGSAGSTSAVNYGFRDTVANSSIAPVATDGTVTIRNGGVGSVEAIVDVTGYTAP